MVVPEMGVDTVTTPRDVASHGWPELIRALAHLRAGVAAIDRMLSGSGLSAPHLQLTMVLTESSHATHHALVRLGEASELLAHHHGCSSLTGV